MQLLRVHILIESTSSNTNTPELGVVNRAVGLGWNGQNKTLKDPQRPTLVFPIRKTGLVRGGADVMKRARSLALRFDSFDLIRFIFLSFVIFRLSHIISDATIV